MKLLAPAGNGLALLQALGFLYMLAHAACTWRTKDLRFEGDKLIYRS